MTDDDYTEAIRGFLAAHPEHIAGVRQKRIEGVMELVMDAEASIAFCVWALNQGRCDPEKAAKFREAMRARYGL